MRFSASSFGLCGGETGTRLQDSRHLSVGYELTVSDKQRQLFFLGVSAFDCFWKVVLHHSLFDQSLFGLPVKAIPITNVPKRYL